MVKVVDSGLRGVGMVELLALRTEKGPMGGKQWRRGIAPRGTLDPTWRRVKSKIRWASRMRERFTSAKLHGRRLVRRAADLHCGSSTAECEGEVQECLRSQPNPDERTDQRRPTNGDAKDAPVESHPLRADRCGE